MSNFFITLVHSYHVYKFYKQKKQLLVEFGQFFQESKDFNYLVTLETITLVYIKKISNIINNQDICRKIGPSFIEHRFTICSQKHIALITKCCLFLFPNMFLCNFLNILFGRVFKILITTSIPWPYKDILHLLVPTS